MWHTEMLDISMKVCVPYCVRYLLGCDFHIVLSTDDKAEQEVRDGTTVEWKKAEQTQKLFIQIETLRENWIEETETHSQKIMKNVSLSC